MAKVTLDYFELAQMFGLQFIECSEYNGTGETHYKFQFHDYGFTHGDQAYKSEDEMMEQAGKATLLAIGHRVSQMLK